MGHNEISLSFMNAYNDCFQFYDFDDDLVGDLFEFVDITIRKTGQTDMANVCSSPLRLWCCICCNTMKTGLERAVECQSRGQKNADSGSHQHSSYSFISTQRC